MSDSLFDLNLARFSSHCGKPVKPYDEGSDRCWELERYSRLPCGDDPSGSCVVQKVSSYFTYK